MFTLADLGELPHFGGRYVTILFFGVQADTLHRGLEIWHGATADSLEWYLWGVATPAGVVQFYEMTGHTVPRDSLPPTIFVRTRGILPWR